jgi:segregation and condensation protein B
MRNTEKIKSIIEALLIVSEGGLSSAELKSAITDSDTKDIDEGIRLLREEYSATGRAFNIAEIAGKYRIVTQPEYMPWISNLYQKVTDRLTGPSLETLAIIAYKQPVTRAEVESVRGVNVGGVLKTLLEKDLIRIRGRKDVPGKFLEIFGLNSLEDLPLLKSFSEEDLEYGMPQEQSIVAVEDTKEEDHES